MVQLLATAAIEYVAAGHFFPGGILAGEFLSGGAFARGTFVRGGLCLFLQVQRVCAPSRLSVPSIGTFGRGSLGRGDFCQGVLCPGGLLSGGAYACSPKFNAYTHRLGFLCLAL